MSTDASVAAEELSALEKSRPRAPRRRLASRRRLPETKQEHFPVYLAGETTMVFYADAALARKWLDLGLVLVFPRGKQLVLRAKPGCSLRDLLELRAAGGEEIPDERCLEVWEKYLRDRTYVFREMIALTRLGRIAHPYALKRIHAEVAEFFGAAGVTHAEGDRRPMARLTQVQEASESVPTGSRMAPSIVRRVRKTLRTAEGI